MDIPAAANSLGTLGAISTRSPLNTLLLLTKIGLLVHPGLQPSMMMLWAWAGVPLGVYNIVEGLNIALQIQPQILTFLSLLTWAQCYYYEKKWPILHTLAITTSIACIQAGIETALVYGLRIGRSRDITWPIILTAVLSAALLAAGVLRHYFDIYMHKTVRGISFLFVGIDALGDLTSLLSVLFEPSVDMV